MIDFKSKLIREILGYYLINNGASKYLRDLASNLGADPGNLSKKLAELEKEGFLKSEKEGKQKYFSINSEYPFLNEVKKIYQGQFALPLTIKRELGKISGLEEAYIFGSYAQGKMSADSDIDLLLVGDFDSIVANRLILPLQKKIGREINIIDFGKKEFAAKMKSGDDFLKQVFASPHLKII